MEIGLKHDGFCAIVAVLVYANTFQADFVYDDNRAILQNPDVVQTSPLLEVFKNDFWGTPLNHSGSHRSYRPITTLTFRRELLVQARLLVGRQAFKQAPDFTEFYTLIFSIIRLNHFFFGLQATSYHVVNVVLHALTTFLFCRVMRYLLRFSHKKLLFAGLLFAVHPIHTEAVAGIVGRADLLATLFFFTTLLTYAQFCDDIDRTSESRRSGGVDASSAATEKIQTLSHRGHGQKSKRKRKSRQDKNSKRKLPSGKASVERGLLNHRTLDAHAAELPGMEGFVDRSADSDDSHTTSDTLDSVSTASTAAASDDPRERFRDLSGDADPLLDYHTNSDELDSKPTSSRVERPQPTSRKCFNSLQSVANFGKSTTGESSSCWTENALLCLSCLSAMASLLSKEQGCCALPVCIVYDICIRNRLGIKGVARLIFDKDCKLRHVRLRVLSVFAVTVLTVLARLFLPFLMSSERNFAPGFSTSDNPAASRPDFQTRALTFNYLLFFNSRLFFWPTNLSFDWSMDAIPLVNSLWDARNLATTLFYFVLGIVLKYVWDSRVLDDLKIPSNNSKLKTCSKSLAQVNLRRTSSSSLDGDSFARGAPSVHTSITELRYATTDDEINGCAAKQRARAVLFGMAITVLAFLPASNLFFYVGFVVAERVLYLPSVGVCICTAEGLFLAFEKISSRFSHQRRRKLPPDRQSSFKTSLFLSFMFVIILCLATRTWNRNKDWKNEMTLYSSGVTTNPAKALGNLANVYRVQGRYRDAEAAYVQALKHRSNMADVHYNLGLLHQDEKRYKEAEASYLEAIRFRPHLALAHLNLGVVLAEQGRVKEAKKVYERAASIDDAGVRDPRAHARAQTSAFYNLGCLLADEGRHVEAVAAYKKAVARQPVDYKPHSLYNMLGQSLHHLGIHEEAEVWFKTSLAIKPDHVPSHLTYARLLSDMKRFEQAEKLYNDALSLSPGSPVIYQHYSNFLAARGQFTQGAAVMEQSMARGMSDYDSVLAAASAHRHAKDYDKAESYYTRAAQMKPEIALAHMNLGAILHLRGRYSQAEESYQKALSLKPGDPVIEENLAKLRRTVREHNKH